MTVKKRTLFGPKGLEKKLGSLGIGEFIHTWRTSEEMSLKDFGKRVGMSVANLCDIEKGRRTVHPERAAAFARVLGYSVNQFVAVAVEDELRKAGLAVRVRLDAA